MIDARIIDKDKIRELQNKIDESLFGELNRPHKWLHVCIEHRESLRLQLACALDGRHYGEHR